MASIERRRDGRYRARWREHPGGPQKSQHFAKKADAEQFLDGIRGDLVRGTYVDPKAGKVTFRSYAEDWRKAQVHRDGTARSIEQQLRLHVYPTIGDRQLTSVRQTEVQALVRALGEKLAPSTIEVVYGRVSAVFGAAVRDRLIASSPCVGVKRLRPAPQSMLEVLTTENVLALAGAVPDRYRALITTAAGTGMRPGELFGLTVDRVDFLRKQLRVDQQLVRVHDDAPDRHDDRDDAALRVRLGPLKTQASYRTIPLPSTVGDALAAHLAMWPVHTDLGLAFTNDRGAPIQQHPFSVIFERARGAAKLPAWATPHDLRHYYASLLVRSGASVKVVQSRLGHASAKTTLDTYGHLFADEEDRTRDAVDEALRRSNEIGADGNANYDGQLMTRVTN